MPLRALNKRYHPPWAKGRYAKLATSGTALRAMTALPATPPAYIELLGSLAAQALLVHGNSCPLAATAPWRAGSWEQMLHHIGSDNPCRHSLSKRSAPRELQGRTLSVAGCRASFLIMSHLRSPRQSTLTPIQTNKNGETPRPSGRKRSRKRPIAEWDSSSLSDISCILGGRFRSLSRKA